MTAPQELRTTRLLLRSIEHADIPAIVRLAGTREIAATTLRIPHPYGVEDAQNFFAKAKEDFLSRRSIIFAISILPERDLCGAVGLDISEAHWHAELGYWIGLPFWGKGYATEAASAVIEFGFQSLGLHRIYAQHFAENTASQRVLEKIGMRQEGRSREHFKKWDRYIDIENYGLLGKEFRSSK